MIDRAREGSSSLAGRYLLGTELGHGGMAVVYSAWDTRLNRDVAIKLMRDVVLPDARSRARFDAEGQTLAGLSHPALTAIFDAGTHGDRPFLVMELVKGETLGERYRRCAMSIAEVAAVGVPVADALTYVHGCGVVHRDVKPSNILLGTDGSVRLADFGIARLLTDAADQLTATGMTMGTAAYLAPEQVRGLPAEPASDVYALGLVLLEALERTPVFSGSPDVAALARLVSAPVIDERLPSLLRDLLAAMTAEQPADRPSAGEVGTVLRQILHPSVPAMTSVTRSATDPPPGPRSTPAAPAASAAPTAPAAPAVIEAALVAGSGAATPIAAPSKDTVPRSGLMAGVLAAVAATALVSVLGFTGLFETHRTHTGSVASPSTSLSPHSSPSVSRSDSTPLAIPTPTTATIPTAIGVAVVAASADSRRTTSVLVQSRSPSPARAASPTVAGPAGADKGKDKPKKTPPGQAKKLPGPSAPPKPAK